MALWFPQSTISLKALVSLKTDFRQPEAGLALSPHWLSTSSLPVTNVVAQPLSFRTVNTPAASVSHQHWRPVCVAPFNKQGIQKKRKPVKHGTVHQPHKPLRSAEDQEGGYYNRHHWAGNDSNIRFPCYDAAILLYSLWAIFCQPMYHVFMVSLMLTLRKRHQWRVFHCGGFLPICLLMLVLCGTQTGVGNTGAFDSTMSYCHCSEGLSVILTHTRTHARPCVSFKLTPP